MSRQPAERTLAPLPTRLGLVEVRTSPYNVPNLYCEYLGHRVIAKTDSVIYVALISGEAQAVRREWRTVTGPRLGAMAVGLYGGAIGEGAAPYSFSHTYPCSRRRIRLAHALRVLDTVFAPGLVAWEL